MSQHSQSPWHLFGSGAQSLTTQLRATTVSQYEATLPAHSSLEEQG